MLTTTFVATLSYPSQAFQRLLQAFIYENILGYTAKRLPAASRLPSLQGTYVVPHRLLRVGYISLLDSTDGTDVMRITPDWFGTGSRRDFAVVQDDGSEEPWFARLLEVIALTFNGVVHRIAYIQRFRTRSHRSKLTGYIELQDRNEYGFIFVDSIVRSCVVLSPNVHSSRLVVSDLSDSDMYLRLLDAS